jgi:hypothetical protein
MALINLSHQQNFMLKIYVHKYLRNSSKNHIFALTISATPLFNAYQGGTFAFITL